MPYTDREWTPTGTITTEQEAEFIRHLDRIRDLIVDIGGQNEGCDDQASMLTEVAYLATTAANLHPRWAFCVNQPGYLPEREIEVYDTWQDAHGAMFEYVHTCWDQDSEADHDDDQADAIWLPVDTALNTATHGQPIFEISGDGKWSLQVYPVQRGLTFTDPADDDQ